MELEQMKKEIVQFYLAKKQLINKEFIQQLNDEQTLVSTYKNLFSNKKPTVIVKKDFEQHSNKRTAQDFVSYFTSRYKIIETILSKRQELKNLTAISRVKTTKDRQNVSVIALLLDKQTTKNNNLVLELEDRTGTIKAIIKKDTKVFEQAKDIMMDEVIGVIGTTGQDVLFPTGIIVPDLPIRELKKSPEEEYMAIVSDIHYGQKSFMHDSFNKFLNWINSDDPVALKTNYVFIPGDLVEGVGIFPGQEKELSVKDIYDQYKGLAELLSKIPSRIQLIITPGNHDAIRQSEPQPRLSEQYSGPLYQMKNVTLLSNPCWVNIGSTKDFSGFDCLVYHGSSFPYYSNTVESIRSSGRPLSERTELVMKYLLQRRHLAPTHSSTLYVPDMKDNLVIEESPDFFISGHIHRISIGHYRGTDVICGSAWHHDSEYAEKMGQTPDPGKIPIVNLQTRKITIMDFT